MNADSGAGAQNKRVKGLQANGTCAAKRVEAQNGARFRILIIPFLGPNKAAEQSSDYTGRSRRNF